MSSNTSTNTTIMAFLLMASFIAVAEESTVNTEKQKINSSINKVLSSNDKKNTEGPMDQALIKVDGASITSRDYVGFLQQHPQIISRAINSEKGKAEALREMVSAFLLQKAIYDEGILTPSDKEVSQQKFAEAYEKLAERHFPLPPNTNDSEGFTYYQAHKNEFGIPAMLRFNEILIKVNPKADDAVKKSSKDKIDAAFGRIKSGEKISKIASEVTENPIGKVTEGDIGFVDPLQEPWIGDSLKGLKAGDHTGVLTSPEGYVILEITDIRQGIISPYANVRDKVFKSVRDEKQKSLRDPYVKSLSKKAKIEVIAPQIKDIFPNGVIFD